MNELKLPNQLLTKITIKEIQESSLEYHYEILKNSKIYNTVRLTIFNNLIEDFINPVIEKGLTKEHQRIALKNNYGEFHSFLERKIRYWLAELLEDGLFKEPIENYNQQLLSEVENHFIVLKNENTENLITHFHVTSLTYIEKSNIEKFPKIISDFILSKNEYKEVILSYFNEFLKYLIVF